MTENEVKKILEKEFEKRNGGCAGCFLFAIFLFVILPVFLMLFINLFMQHGVEIELWGEKYMIGHPEKYGLPIPGRIEDKKVGK